MIIATQEHPADLEITQTLGLVRGNTIRARHIGNDILASLRNLIGGEVTEYTKMLAEAREQSLDRMIQQARRLGADAIVGVRFTTSPVMQGAAELLAYGTAVRIRKPPQPGEPPRRPVSGKAVFTDR
ncbi:MAG: YbjQ family protein [Pseudomonadales bacterium]|nr:YbjQ family protein [Pseudomonadales bacterium]